MNTARNCLRYIIRNYKIQTLYVPSYTCPVVWEAVRSEGCGMHFYSIDHNFLPQASFPTDASSVGPLPPSEPLPLPPFPSVVPQPVIPTAPMAMAATSSHANIPFIPLFFFIVIPFPNIFFILPKTDTVFAVPFSFCHLTRPISKKSLKLKKESRKPVFRFPACPRSIFFLFTLCYFLIPLSPSFMNQSLFIYSASL